MARTRNLTLVAKGFPVPGPDHPALHRLAVVSEDRQAGRRALRATREPARDARPAGAAAEREAHRLDHVRIEDRPALQARHARAARHGVPVPPAGRQRRALLSARTEFSARLGGSQGRMIVWGSSPGRPASLTLARRPDGHDRPALGRNRARTITAAHEPKGVPYEPSNYSKLRRTPRQPRCQNDHRSRDPRSRTDPPPYQRSSREPSVRHRESPR
jgi:hypothetical protein